MTKNHWKRLQALVLAGVLAVCAAFPAMAESRKKITSVSLDVESEMRIGDDIEPSQVQIETKSDKYYVGEIDFTNVGFYWSAEDVPQIEVYLYAEDGYYFSLKNTDVHLDGATYVKAIKPSGMDSTVLKITMDLPSMAGRMDELETIQFGKDGLATWNPVEGAGYYEVRLSRNSTVVGGTQTVNVTSAEFGYLMTKAASYTVKVRPVSQVNWENKGSWAASAPVYVDAAMAAQFKEASHTPGEWVKDETGWRFQNEDGTFMPEGWHLITGKWYYFGEDTYMWANAWVNTDSFYYYVGADGAMLRSTIVPGTEYYVNSAGVWVQP